MNCNGNGKSGREQVSYGMSYRPFFPPTRSALMCLRSQTAITADRGATANYCTPYHQASLHFALEACPFNFRCCAIQSITTTILPQLASWAFGVSKNVALPHISKYLSSHNGGAACNLLRTIFNLERSKLCIGNRTLAPASFGTVPSYV